MDKYRIPLVRYLRNYRLDEFTFVPPISFLFFFFFLAGKRLKREIWERGCRVKLTRGNIPTFGVEGRQIRI